MTVTALAAEEVGAGPSRLFLSPALFADAFYSFADEFDVGGMVIKIDDRKIADASDIICWCWG